MFWDTGVASIPATVAALLMAHSASTAEAKEKV